MAEGDGATGGYRGSSLIGEMYNRVTIQRRTVSRDDYGAAVYTWTALAGRWASIKPVKGVEDWIAQQVRPGLKIKVIIRSYSGLTPKDRFLYGDRILNILSVMDLEEVGRFMECVCMEEVS